MQIRPQEKERLRRIRTPLGVEVHREADLGEPRPGEFEDRRLQMDVMLSETILGRDKQIVEGMHPHPRALEEQDTE